MPDWSAFADVDPSAPGLVAGVAKDGTVEAFCSAGVDAPGGESLQPDTIFYVASIAKQFTAACIGALVLDGRLGLADSVRRWLPELSPSWQPVQLHHLVAHCGGLQDSNAVDSRIGWGVNSHLTTWARFEAIAATEPESVALCTDTATTATCCWPWSWNARQVRPWARSLAMRFAEAGMTDSRFLDTPGPDAVPGWVGGRQRIDIQFTYCGDGGLVTSPRRPRPMGRLATCLPPEPVDARRSREPSERTDHDAWGISIRRHHGLRIESHGGSIDGYLATFVRVPAAALAIIVLTNTDRFGVTDFGRRTASAGRFDPWRPSRPHPAPGRNARVSHWTADRGGRVAR